MRSVLPEPWVELTGARSTLTADIKAFGKEAAVQTRAWQDAGRHNAGLTAARAGLHPLADRCRDLTKQIDLAVKLAGRVIDIAVKELDARNSDAWDNGDVNRARKVGRQRRRRRRGLPRRPTWEVPPLSRGYDAISVHLALDDDRDD